MSFLQHSVSLRSQEKQALKIVRFQRHLPLTIQFYISCRISGVPPLQSDFSGLSSALKDDTNEPKKRKEARTKPTKMARKKSTLRMTRTTTDILPTSTFLPAFTTRIQQGRDCRREGAKEWKRRVLAQLLRVRSSHWHVARSTTRQRTIYGSPQTDPAQSAQL